MRRGEREWRACGGGGRRRGIEWEKNKGDRRGGGWEWMKKFWVIVVVAFADGAGFGVEKDSCVKWIRQG